MHVLLDVRLGNIDFAFGNDLVGYSTFIRDLLLGDAVLNQ